MATEIKMPQLSDTMDAGKILVWKKNEGDTVKRGDILAEVETDKANLEIEAFHEGVLIKVSTPAGQTAKVGEVIAVIGSANETYQANGSQPAPVQENKTVALKDNNTAMLATPAQQVSQHVAVQEVSHSDRIKASPLAKKLAQQNNVNLGQVHGSGPNGRIVKKDIEQAKSQTYSSSSSRSTPNYSEPVAPPQSASTPTTGGQLTSLSKMRATIAKRMQQAVLEAPHFYTTMSIDMTEASKLRAIFKTQPEYKEVSINHLIIKACAYALSKVPGVNCAVKEEQLYTPNEINIGVITAVEGGLLIPVIRNTDKLNLKDLSFETRSAIDRARAGRPSATDLSGGTFSISNMGMFGVENFTAIISPGQGAILAVGATLDQAVVKNGTVQSAPIMKVTLSVDHRIIDGTMAGNWLVNFKQGLEQPALLLL